MFAIIEFGGKQYNIEEGKTFLAERIPEGVGDTIQFEKVLLFSDGKETKIGTPYLEGVSISADVVDHVRDKKKIVFRYHSKNRYRKMKGHRQPYTKVRVTKISS